MFINIAIAPGAVVGVSSQRQGFASHLLRKNLFELITKYGSIVQPSSDSAKALVDVLKSEVLTPSEEKEWREFLIALKKRKRFSVVRPEVPQFWEHVSDAQSYESMLSKPSVLSILTEEGFQSVFGDEGGVHSVASDIEVTTPATASLSQSAQKLGSFIEGGTFAKSTPRETIWEELLGPLAVSSDQIVIFDPYLYYRVWQESIRTAHSSEHLEWLLEKLHQLPPGNRQITLLGAAGDEQRNSPPKEPGLVLDFLESHFKGFFDSTIEVNAYVVPERRLMHHDRHISFSSGQALELPSGFDRLATPRLRGDMSFTYRHTPHSLQSLERRVVEAREARGTLRSQLG